MLKRPSSSVAVAEIAEAVAAQFGVKALAAEAEHFGRRGAVVVGQFQRRLDAQPLDEIGGFAHEVLQRHAADEVDELLDRARQFAPAEPLAAGSPADRAYREAVMRLAGAWEQHAGDLDIFGGAEFAAHDGGKMPDGAVGAQIGEQNVDVDDGRPSQRSIFSPLACASTPIWARSRKAALAAMTRRSALTIA